MKKLIAFVVFLTLFCTSVPVLALDAPTLTVTTSGVNVTLSWTSVPSATGYTLFYAPYPDASSIGQIDMGAGTQTSVSFDANGLAFYVVLQSYNSSGSSGYSNIEYFDLSLSVKIPDECGVIDGDGSTCAGCDGVPNSGLVPDSCGICGGNGSSCQTCISCCEYSWTCKFINNYGSGTQKGTSKSTGGCVACTESWALSQIKNSPSNDCVSNIKILSIGSCN